MCGTDATKEDVSVKHLQRRRLFILDGFMRYISKNPKYISKSSVVQKQCLPTAAN